MKIVLMLVGVAIALIALGSVIPVLWPLAAGTSTNITAMSGTDSGTVMIKAFWPIVLLLCGLGLGIAVIVFALRKFGLMGGTGI